jgi:hypothetical protein
MYHLQFHLKQSHSVVHSLTQLALPARPSPMSSNKSHSAGLTQPVLFAKSLLSFHLISNFKPNIFSTNLISSHIILQASLSYNAHCAYPICSKSLFFAIIILPTRIKKSIKLKKRKRVWRRLNSSGPEEFNWSERSACASATKWPLN